MVAYTRQKEADIADGLVIEAADLNAEFDAILAFCQAPTIGAGAAGTDIALTFDGETNDGVITWMEDEDYFRFSDGKCTPISPSARAPKIASTMA